MRRSGCAARSSEKHDSLMNLVMLRFRPIAPKPAAGEPVSSAAKISGTRTKRKYFRIRSRKNSKAQAVETGRSLPIEKSGPDHGLSPDEGVAMPQLMLERSESDGNCNGTVQKNMEGNQDSPRDEVNLLADIDRGEMAVPESVRSAIKTWIIVECVTDTFTDGGVGLGLTDWDKIRNLGTDTCPGFLSDGANKVVWINEAYRKMVAEGEVEETGIMVWLALKEELPSFIPAFACRVRMSQQTKQGYKWNRIVACDVWRMGFEGFAWKLDVNTALGLGL